MRCKERRPEHKTRQTGAAATAAQTTVWTAKQSLLFQIVQKDVQIVRDLLRISGVILGNPRHGRSRAARQRLLEHAGTDRRNGVEFTPHVQQPRTAIVYCQKDNIGWQKILGLSLHLQSRKGLNAGYHFLVLD